MNIIVKYDKYNTKIEEARIELEGDNALEFKFTEEIINEGEPEEETIQRMEMTATDGLGADIPVPMEKGELKDFIFLVRNLYNQL